MIASADLEAVRDVVLAALDELAEAASDTSYPKLIALKATVIKPWRIACQRRLIWCLLPLKLANHRWS